MVLKTQKQIYDNVHGYIGLTEVELQVVDTPLFQRLRNVAQLGPANLVYPGATHTRFEHCLGTMFVMDQFLQHVRSGGAPITEDPDTIQTMRLAALLHDIGHYPMSHTLENVITRKMGGSSHTRFGTALLGGFYKELLSPYGIGKITAMIRGENRDPLGMLLSSAFDADKSDYLLRDAYHTGVGYGRVGLQRLIRNASFERGRIVFGKDDEAVESFLVGRYHMYRSVYHHKTVTAFYVMASRIFERFVEENVIRHPNDILGSADESEILAYDDHMVYSAMHGYARDGKDAQLRELVRMFLLRKPLSAAFMNVIPEERERSQANLVVKEIEYDDRRRESFAAEAGVPAEWIFPAYVRDLGLVDDRTPIFVGGRGHGRKITDSHGLIMQVIGKRRLYDARIYVPRRYKSRIAGYMRGLDRV